MTLLNPDTDHLLIKGAGPMHDGKDIMLRLTFANAARSRSSPWSPTRSPAAAATSSTSGSSYFLN